MSRSDRAGATAAPDRFDRRLLPPMILGSVLNPINSSIIAVALVPIAVAFGAPAAETAWLISALYLATAIGQPLTGRLVDVFGPRRIYLVGSALIAIAGVGGMLAPDLGVLIAARVLLGFGTCVGFPAAMFLIRAEAERTGQDSPAGALTALAVAAQTIAVIGPPLGGLLIALGGWRATFAVNVPLAVACLVLGWLALPRAAAPGRGGPPRPRSDYPGVILFAITLGSLLIFLMNVRAGLWWLLLITGVAATGFAVRELRTPDPFVDVRVLAGNPPLLATYGRTLLTYTVSYCFLYGFTQWLEDGRGLAPSVAGLVLLPAFGVGILVSSTTGRRPEIRAKLVTGAIAQLLVCVLLLQVTPRSPLWMLLGISAVLGLPQGLNSLANQNALYYQADPGRMGASSGLLRTFMYLGAMISSAATAAFFGARADTSGLHGLAIFMLAAAGIVVIMSAADRALAGVGRTAG